jgi:DNA topoisomerase-3
MKEMVKALVVEVITEREVHSITIEEEPAAKETEGESDGKKAKAKREKKPKDDKPVELTCPKCKKGKVLQGKTAYGCSEYKNGCGFRLSFEQFGKKLTDKQVESLIANGKTSKIKGFTLDGTKCEGILTLNANGEVELQRDEAPAKEKKFEYTDEFTCPSCGQGKILQGKTAFGCSRWKEGCNFKIPFDDIEFKYPNRELNLMLLDEYLKKDD